MTSNSADPSEREKTEVAKDCAFEKYSILVQYLVFENQAFWTRAGFLLLAHTALFGFFASNLPTIEKPFQWEKWIASLFLSVAGFVLYVIGRRVLNIATKWIEDLEAALKKCEEHAIGEPVLTTIIEKREGEMRGSSKKNARHVLTMFAVLWLLAMMYCLLSLLVSVARSSG